MGSSNASPAEKKSNLLLLAIVCIFLVIVFGPGLVFIWTISTPHTVEQGATPWPIFVAFGVFAILFATAIGLIVYRSRCNAKSGSANPGSSK